MVKLHADLSRETGYLENGNGGGKTIDISRYSPLPNDPGLVVHNKVVLSLVNPARWALFNPDAEAIDKYGLSSNPVFSILDWGHLYFQLPTHNVMKFSYPNGNTGFAKTLCPIALNKYLVEGLDLPPLFDTPVRCAFCEEKARLWDEHNQAWLDLGLDKQSLSTEGYRAALQKHAILRETKEAARRATASEQYVISVFDHDKFTQKRPYDEGQTGPVWQYWHAPGSIYKGVREIHAGLTEANQPAYFDFERPDGVSILTVVKDTTEWTPTSKIKTTYNITPYGERHVYDEGWLAYLNDGANYADPSSSMHLLSYEEQKYYLSQQTSSPKSYNRPQTHVSAPQPAQANQPAAPAAVTAQAQAPVAQPPQAQTAPAPVAPAQATAPPQVQAPVQTQAPAPSAPAPAPVAPSAPAQAPAPAPAPAPVGAPPIPVLPVVAQPPQTQQAQAPASPAPAVGGAPVPDRQPPVGDASAERMAWD